MAVSICRHPQPAGRKKSGASETPYEEIDCTVAEKTTKDYSTVGMPEALRGRQIIHMTLSIYNQYNTPYYQIFRYRTIS